ncbi:AI-2E family transporter [Streptacidiphilus jiangxiensis]|uniref:Predicted PurR-regulated permease PerM n=1 Tax=Streptacidiphilus jiangxiensis TaxID=235985 RepID=A0A1H7H7P3_STRJI|nr:AI-2E family transporter [Streptacidiphilus jiangxiensis]SEK46248.1 Predicted PurR-regulated permease PerM [Streptacidiphilus jiangxiensis]
MFVQTAAGWAWRLLVLGAAAYALFQLLVRFQPVVIAVFLGLVVTALLRPLADRLSRVMPRVTAVLCAYVLAVLIIAVLLSVTGLLVADEAPKVVAQFDTGIGRVEHWLEGSPFHVRPGALTGLQQKITAFISTHRSSLLQSAVNGATQAVEILTVAALGLFCSVFFVYSGERMWDFCRDQLPAVRRDGWQRGGTAALGTLSGYIRGIILVAATNAVLVGIALFALRVPLAGPLAMLEFLAAFVPLIGSPVALAVASAVALAARGPITAVIVLGLIVVIGEIEGHLLHPLIMSWAVRLHPVVVAVSVIAGTIALGIIGAVLAVPAVSVVWAVTQALRTPASPERSTRGARAT